MHGGGSSHEPRSRLPRLSASAAKATTTISIAGRRSSSARRWPGREARRSRSGSALASNGFPIQPSDTPFRAPGHMQTAYPDFRHYTARDYGTRVGFYRLLDAFAKAGVRVSVAANAAIAERYPQVIADIVAGGHEIVAHSTDMNGTIASGLPIAEERELIAALARYAGAGVRHAPARLAVVSRGRKAGIRSDLLREAGLSYMLRLGERRTAVPVRQRAGRTCRSTTNCQRPADRHRAAAIGGQLRSADARRLRLAGAARQGSSADGCCRLHVTPYIMGLPYRIGAFEALLSDLAARPEAWFANGGEIVDAGRRSSEGSQPAYGRVRLRDRAAGCRRSCRERATRLRAAQPEWAARSAEDRGARCCARSPPPLPRAATRSAAALIARHRPPRRSHVIEIDAMLGATRALGGAAPDLYRPRHRRTPRQRDAGDRDRTAAGPLSAGRRHQPVEFPADPRR